MSSFTSCLERRKGREKKGKEGISFPLFNCTKEKKNEK